LEFEEIFTRLGELSIDYEKIEHAPVYTCEEADRIAGHERVGKTKNLFLRNKKGNQHYLVILSSQDQVSLGRLAGELGEDKLSFASEARLTRFLRQKPGCVSPLGLVFDKEKHVRVLIQEKVLAGEKLSFHPNLNTVSLIMSCHDLKKYLDSVTDSWKLLSEV